MRAYDGTASQRQRPRRTHPPLAVHGVGVDSRGDVYAGLTLDRSVDKFVRVR